MNKYLSFIAAALCLAAGTVWAAPLEPVLVARIHFAGGDTVAADPNASPLKNLWASPDALLLRAQTLGKLDRFLDSWLHQQIAPAAAPAQLRPLLDDLCRAEWQLELHQSVRESAEFSLAVRLDDARAQTWLKTLAPLVASWKSTSPAHHGQVARKGEWLCFQLGNSPALVPPQAVPPLRNVWLTAEVNWQRLAAWYPAWRKLDLPETRLQVVGRNGNFDVTGNLFLAQPLSSWGPWQFPAATIHGPLISFTAARGISDWLKQQPWAVSLGINPLPDQVFTWVQPQMPFETYAAMPLAAAPAALPLLDQSLNSALHDGSPDSPFNRFTLSEANNQLSLTGMPLIAPYIKATREPAGEFLVAGFFPLMPRGQPVPAAVTARLNVPGLVYYHWENTSERMKLFPQLYQLLLVLSRHRQVEVKSPAGSWLLHSEPFLGSSVTEVTENSPSELSFTRQSPALLTAVELVAFASWLEAPDFPGCDLRLPPPKFPLRHPATPGGPAPFKLHQ